MQNARQRKTTFYKNKALSKVTRNVLKIYKRKNKSGSKPAPVFCAMTGARRRSRSRLRSLLLQSQQARRAVAQRAREAQLQAAEAETRAAAAEARSAAAEARATRYKRLYIEENSDCRELADENQRMMLRIRSMEEGRDWVRLANFTHAGRTHRANANNSDARSKQRGCQALCIFLLLAFVDSFLTTWDVFEASSL